MRAFQKPMFIYPILGKVSSDMPKRIPVKKESKMMKILIPSPVSS